VINVKAAMGSGEQVEKGASFKSVVLRSLHSFGLKSSGFVIRHSDFVIVSKSVSSVRQLPDPWFSALSKFVSIRVHSWLVDAT
jgi:hypothetical protein